MASRPKPQHYRGGYHVAARRVREAAKANPETRCWRCGLTLTEVREQTNPRAFWTAGHVVDGQPDGPLLPECSPCNYSAGQRQGRGGRTELTW